MDEKRTEIVQIARFKGRTFLCPESNLKENQIVAVLKQKVDPKNLYAFVVTPDGIESASRKRLANIRKDKVVWTRKSLMTANQEKAEMVKEIKNHMLVERRYLVKKIKKEEKALYEKAGATIWEEHGTGEPDSIIIKFYVDFEKNVFYKQLDALKETV